MRNRKLKASSYRCDRCQSKRDLQVHHKTYERLGAELDEDLEVLCANCHEGHHVAAMELGPHGVYLKLARQAFREQPFAELSDLSEATKQLCATHRVSYNWPQIHHALELLMGRAITRRPSRRFHADVPADPASISTQDAHEILVKLGLDPATFLQPWPAVLEDTVEHETLVCRQAQAFRSIGPARRPDLQPRLDAIFAGRL